MRRRARPLRHRRDDSRHRRRRRRRLAARLRGAPRGRGRRRRAHRRRDDRPRDRRDRLPRGRSAARAAPRRRARAIAGYLRHLPDAVAESEGYRVMPGVEELLDRLIDAGVLLGLVTGNIEAAAHIKLARAGLNRFFSFGGYGSDSRRPHRGDRRRPCAAPSSSPAAPLDRRRLHRGRRHPARRHGRPRRRDQGRRRRHRQLLGRPSSAKPAPTGRWRPSRTAFRSDADTALRHIDAACSEPGRSR